MNHAAITDNSGNSHAPLSALLTAFAQPFDKLAQAYSTFPQAPADRLNTVLQIMEDIVLPRKLTFFCEETEIGHMIIANRRLTAFEQPGESPVLEEDVESLASRLMTFAQDTRAVTMQAPTRLPLGTSTEQSYSKRALTRALGLVGNTNSMEHMRQLAAPHALSLLVWEGDCTVPDMTGDESWHATLHDFTQRYVDNVQAETFETPVSRGVMLPVSPDLCMLIALHDTRGMAAIIPQQQAHKVIETWQIANG